MAQQAQQQPFRIFDLPLELRQNIYVKLFEDTTTEITEGVYTQRAYDAPLILLTCKQIHNEAISIFYQTTSFYFEVHGRGLRWYSQLPHKHRKRVSRMRYGIHVTIGQRPQRGDFRRTLMEKYGIELKDGVLEYRERLEGEKLVWTSEESVRQRGLFLAC